MNAARLLETARAAGLSLEVEGDNLIVETDRDLTPELITELRQHKAELIAILVPQVLDAVASVPSATVDADELAEPAALVEEGAGVPRQWVEGYAALSTMLPPDGFSPDRWQRVVDATGAFIDRWGAKAAASGWSDLDVFGCNPNRPDARFDAMGLVLLLDRAEVAAVDMDGADLVIPASGSRQRYRRRPLPTDSVPLWRL